MNTILVEPLPNKYVRCVMSDHSTVTMEVEKLPEWLTAHPMVKPQIPSLMRRVAAVFKPQ